MTRINLLPWREARRKQQQRDFLAMIGAGVAVAILGLLIAHLQIARSIEHQEIRNQFLLDEIERLKKVDQEIKQLDQSKERLLSRLEIIQNLQRSRPGMVRMFDGLANRLPDDIFLSTLDSDGNSLTLHGIASANNVVSDFMRELEQSSRFGEPALEIVETKSVNDARASAFKLTVTQTDKSKDPETGEEMVQ